LTIKLTQHAPPSGPSKQRGRVLQALPSVFVRRLTQSWSPTPRTRREPGKFAFPQTLLSSKICGFAPRELEIARRNAYFLQLSKIAFRSTVSDRNVSAPGGARIQFGAEFAKNSNQTKNPATSAGRIRPSLWASFVRALGRMCSKLVFLLPGVRDQHHLWMSRQARSVSRLPRESGLHQHQKSIAISKFPSSGIQDFFTWASQCPCEFQRPQWKSAASRQCTRVQLRLASFEKNIRATLPRTFFTSTNPK